MPQLGVNFALGLQKNQLDTGVAATTCSTLCVYRLKLFDYSTATISAIISAYGQSSSHLQLVVAIPNGELSNVATDPANAAAVVSALAPYAAHISHIAVGNEPLASWYSGAHDATIVPAVSNVLSALQNAGLGAVKVTVPMQMGCLTSTYPPRDGRFSTGCETIAGQLLALLHNSSSPFTMNIYPFFSYMNSLGNQYPIDLDYALGTTSHTPSGSSRAYEGLIDAELASVRAAVDHLGYSTVPLVLGETGWPSGGTGSASGKATLSNSQTYTDNLASWLGSGSANRPELTFLFEAFDEENKPETGAGLGVEPNFGLFYENGTAKFALNWGTGQCVSSGGSSSTSTTTSAPSSSSSGSISTTTTSVPTSSGGGSVGSTSTTVPDAGAGDTGAGAGSGSVASSDASRLLPLVGPSCSWHHPHHGGGGSPLMVILLFLMLVLLRV